MEPRPDSRLLGREPECTPPADGSLRLLSPLWNMPRVREGMCVKRKTAAKCAMGKGGM